MTGESSNNDSGPNTGKSSNEMAGELYDTLKCLAKSQLKNEQLGVTLQPTMLVHEAYLRLCSGTSKWDTEAHFFISAARAMRRILVERARARNSQKRGGKEFRRENTELDELYRPDRLSELIDLDDALSDLATKDPQKALIVEMKFFAGMSVEEISKALGISISKVKRDWRFAKAWLQSQI